MEESVVLCCITRTNNPVHYTVVDGGPLDLQTVKQSSSSSSESSGSESSDFLCFGPVYTSLHADVGYAHRNSLIPSWNHGVIKIWIIAKSCDSKTQRWIPTNSRSKIAKTFEPIHDLAKVLKFPQDYQLLIQRPGQLVRHHGKHFHCVVTAIDVEVNPSRLSLSLGRKDYYMEDNYAFARSTKETLVVKNTETGELRLASRKYFVETQLFADEYKKLRSRIKDDERIRNKRKTTTKRKRKGGFQKGNKCYALKSPRMVRVNY